MSTFGSPFGGGSGVGVGTGDTYTFSTGLNETDGTVTVDFGEEAGTVCEGNDDRLSDNRDPNTHASSHGVGEDDELFDQSLNEEDSVKFESVQVGDPIDTTGVDYPVWEVKDENGDVVARCVLNFDNLGDGTQNGVIKFYVMRSGALTEVFELDGE